MTKPINANLDVFHGNATPDLARRICDDLEIDPGKVEIGRFPDGEIAVTLKDLELLTKFYDVPMIYFVASADVTPGLARAWEKILDGPPELHQTMEISSTFSETFARQLLAVVKAMRNTASYYADHRDRDEPPAARAAEPTSPYPDS